MFFYLQKLQIFLYIFGFGIFCIMFQIFVIMLYFVE